MITGQIQVRLTITDQLYEFLQAKAAKLGLPVTQVIKHMIIQEAEKEEYPVFPASPLTEKKYYEAQSNLDNFVKVDDVKKYLDTL
jgi:antitoxin component of RelBE/YafQ-DinJ toxin-antitoxin module